MLAELVLPEALIISLVIFPVLLHILKNARGILFQDGGDIRVLPVVIAKLLIRPITVVRPAQLLTRACPIPTHKDTGWR